MTIGLDDARTMIAGARAAARTLGLKPLSVVVLDAGGHVTAFEREDGSSNKRFEIAFGKAHGSARLRDGLTIVDGARRESALLHRCRYLGDRWIADPRTGWRADH